jgi:hypothetical protein
MADDADHICTRPWWLRPPVWFIGVAIVALIIFGVVETLGIPPATPYGTFLDQLDAGNVSRVTFQGTQIEGLFKNPVGAAASSGTASQTIFRSRVPDFGDPALLPELRKQHVAIDVASSSSWTRLLARIPLPMLFFVGIIVIAGLVRLVRRGKARSDADVAVHPMQALFGLLSGVFKKPSESGGESVRTGDPPKA